MDNKPRLRVPLLDRVRDAVRDTPVVGKVYYRVSRGRALLEACDPATRLLRRQMRGAPTPPLALVCVYRRRNAANLQALLSQLPPRTQVALWASTSRTPRCTR